MPFDGQTCVGSTHHVLAWNDHWCHLANRFEMPFSGPTRLGETLNKLICHSHCITVLYFSPYVFLYNVSATWSLPKLLWDFSFIRPEVMNTVNFT